ncbi:uncharacterized protein LOC128668535 [Microplitis demolitor]|uniref:uncharacterized protein LOC128668535 n=1 Tax=Microplitis demolitor TaxID=69319 RepID=UPI00235B6644|nr:uncharacterized protein LOC128668535 [Microplitis demolitor]
MQLLGELGRVFQKGREFVLKYSNRICDIATQLVEVHKRTHTQAENNAYAIQVEQRVVESFLNGLNPEIESKIRNLNNDFQGTLDEAIKIEQKIKLRKELSEFENIKRKGNEKPVFLCDEVKREHNNSQKPHQSNSHEHLSNSCPKEIISCDNCKKMGHRIRDCWKKINDEEKQIKENHPSTSNSHFGIFNRIPIKPISDKEETRVEQINLNKNNKSPTILLGYSVTPNVGQISVMLDTSSGPNILKESFCPKEAISDKTKTIKLLGINEIPVEALGEVELDFLDLEIKFLIVPDHFPIEQSGILGSNFFDEAKKESLYDLIKDNTERFHLPGEYLPATDRVEHEILTTDERPVNIKNYRIPYALKEEIDRQIKELLENNIIMESRSPYNSPVWIVPKKPDSGGRKQWRMVIDYRALNEKTIKNAYSLPNITDIIDSLGEVEYYSVLDLSSGFHQIKMKEKDRHKTAFSTILAKPLTKLLQKDVKFLWNQETQEASELLRNKLCELPVLNTPDFTMPFIITTDASGYAIGAVLSQGQIREDTACAYASRVLRDAEIRYETYEKQALAIVFGVKTFRPYVYGKTNFVADDLSRNPIKTEEFEQIKNKQEIQKKVSNKTNDSTDEEIQNQPKAIKRKKKVKQSQKRKETKNQDLNQENMKILAGVLKQMKEDEELDALYGIPHTRFLDNDFYEKI